MSGNKQNINIIYLDDNLDDQLLLKHTLSKTLDCTIRFASNENQFLENLEVEPDIIISDFKIPGYGGREALKAVRSRFEITPFLFLSGTLGEETAVGLLLEGANDFLLKQNIERVPNAIIRLLKEAENKRQNLLYKKQLEEKSNLLNTIISNIKDLIFLKDINGKFLAVNKAFCDQYSVDEETILGNTNDKLPYAELRDRSYETDKTVVKSKKHLLYDFEYTDEKGNRVIVETLKTPLINSKGKIDGIVGVGRNITDKKIVEESLKRNEMLLEHSEVQTKSGSFQYDVTKDELICSNQFKTILGFASSRNVISFDELVARIYVPERSLFTSEVYNTVNEKKEFIMEHRIRPLNKKGIVYCRTHIEPDLTKKDSTVFYGTIVDITSERITKKAILDAQENERRALAAELHDSLSQKLVASIMYLSSVKQPDDRLGKALELVSEGLEETRKISRTLSLHSIENLGFKKAVIEVLESFPTSMKIEHHFEFNEKHLEKDVTFMLYRIIQEGMTNIIKYSKAKKVCVKMVEMDHILQLNIKDDGVGFDVGKELNGNGIRNIQERVSKCNGLLTINSAPGKGTNIEIRVPFK